MKMNKEKQKEVLMSSFDVLNQNFEGNQEAIGKIIVKMLKIDMSVAVEMWEYIFKNHKSTVIDGDECFYIMGKVIYDGSEAIGDSTFLEMVLSNPLVKKSVFELSGSVYQAANMIYGIVERNDVATANELLDLLYKNPNKEESWYEILDTVIPVDTEITETTYDCLMSWIDKVKNKQEQTKLKLKMMEFVEE